MRFDCISPAPLWKANKPQPSKQSWVSMEQGWPGLCLCTPAGPCNIFFFFFLNVFIPVFRDKIMEKNEF